MTKLGCWEGLIGQQWKAASTSSVAACVLGEVSMTMADMSWKEPQSQLRVLVSISELSDGQSASLQGYEKSWTRQNSPGVIFGTMPRGEVQKGPIKDSSWEEENGPV